MEILYNSVFHLSEWSVCDLAKRWRCILGLMATLAILSRCVAHVEDLNRTINLIFFKYIVEQNYLSSTTHPILLNSSTSLDRSYVFLIMLIMFRAFVGSY